MRRRTQPWSCSLLLLALTCACDNRTPQADPIDETGGQPTLAPAVAASEPAKHTAVTATAVDDVESAFKRAIQQASPAVVSVYTTRTLRSRVRPGLFGDPRLEQFFGLAPGQTHEFTQRGLGSGFIVDAQGHIMTNYHVVGQADAVKVRLTDGREFDATLVGVDPPTDLALLKIDANNLQPVEIGSSSAVEVGDWVLAIGNPYGLPRTVSAGIISAKGRANVGIIDFEDFIQTDAAVNPGNSGGPLVDLDGRVVAITTAIASRGGGNEGIAFAIPIDMAKSVIDQLLAEGKVTRGNLGVVISDMSDELAQTFDFTGKGILVQDVMPDSSAAAAGLQSGDIIVELDGKPVESVPAFRSKIADQKPGTRVSLGIWREGKNQTITAELGTAPSHEVPAQPNQPPQFGLGLADVNAELRQRFGIEQTDGVIVTDVIAGSPAATAGLRVGDVLVAIGSDEVESAAQAAKRLREIDPSERVRLRIRRGGVGQYVLIEPRD